MKTMYDALLYTKQIIDDCMPDVFAFLGWTDINVASNKALRDALAGPTVKMAATIRPHIVENESDNGYGLVSDTMSLHIILAYPAPRAADVETAIQATSEFYNRFRVFILQQVDAKEPSGFSKIRVLNSGHPIHDPADNYALAMVEVQFQTKGDIYKA